MSTKYPDMLVGAGTVLTIEQVDKAVAAGAKFIVSPGFDPEIVDYCIEKEIPVLPGVVTPSEAIQAVKRGLEVVKFFPGRAVWRSGNDKGTGSAVYHAEIHADRRRECEKPETQCDRFDRYGFVPEE